MKRRPYISAGHLVLEILSYVIILTAVFYAIRFALRADGQIPIHFNAAGAVDGYGSPWTLLIAPLVMTASNIVMSICLHAVPPNRWNLPFKPHYGREVLIYRDIASLLVAVMMTLSVWALGMTAAWARGRGNAITALTVVLTIVLFAEIIFFAVISSRHNRL